MRAFIFHLNSFIYPDDIPDKELSLSIFYATLHGYKLQNKKFVVNQNTGVVDDNNIEIYEDDELEITYEITKADASAGMKSVYRGWVKFDDGGFVITNPAEQYYDHLCTPVYPFVFGKRIIGNKYER